MVETQSPAPDPAPEETDGRGTLPDPTRETVTVGVGDSLEALARRLETTAGALYSENSTAIEAAARAAGHAMSHGGAILVHGIELVVPKKSAG